MKKAFSLIEVIIAVIMLSVTMVTLLQVKSNNIHLLSINNQKVKLNEYILLAIDFKKEISDNKNESIDINKKYLFENDDLRKELKDIKVNIQDDKMDKLTLQNGFNNINITTFSKTFTIEDNNIKKKLYSFKIEL